MEPTTTEPDLCHDKKPEHDDSDDSGEGEHEGGAHAAVHQAEHRVAEKAGFGLAEHVIEHAAEKTSERVLEHGAESLLEHGAERVLEQGTGRAIKAASGRILQHSMSGTGERLAERTAEAVVERGAEAVGERLVVRAAAGATQFAEGKIAHVGANATAHGTHASTTIALGSAGLLHSGLQVVKVMVPMLGTGMVMHMTHEDWHRVHREWHHCGICLTTFLFIFAALCDSFDVLVHLCVVTDLLLMHINHHVLHALESWSMYAAGGALLSMVVGELLSGRASQTEKAKEE
jgi:hypothetical protein